MRSWLRIAMIILAVEVFVAIAWAGRPHDIPVRARSDCAMPIPLLEAKIADIDQRTISAETSLRQARSDVDADKWLVEIQILMAERIQEMGALSRCSTWVATQDRIDAAPVTCIEPRAPASLASGAQGASEAATRRRCTVWARSGDRETEP
jgi:hypothetical protein